ncbi:site-specific integrase [Rhodococcus sp. WS1]|uniref:tyrosine-type recombinase/integrase n=1 Tax=unclassified Rhodococcus (in: high G+C Gram-positive bacteria) TaxID=192944 RepID=UPI0011421273|nr:MULTISPECIES: site-specific integrase [unclassified Rhodococcus (in: high G+C Gram-positive bacteria)]ROZ53528.1 site-specific integrase [Rhodococcus sp. WS1]TQC36766.1 site-specific integrase [Rhodococcus sp. WS7]
MTAPKRNRRAGVEDLWRDLPRPRPLLDENGNQLHDDDGAPLMTLRPKLYGKGKRWRARYVDHQSGEHTKRFDRKVSAQNWLDSATAALEQGTHVAPRDAQLTVEQWCDQWLLGYSVHRDSTVRQARTHIAQINAAFGGMQLAAVRPSAVKTWTAQLKAEGFADSYVYALHSRLAQILGDAVHDGLLGRNPCSRRTSPPMGRAKMYVITTEQLWAVHDAMPAHYRVAILLGAFAGLRISEAAATLVDDVDFIRGVVHPKRQWPDKPLKTQGSDAAIPVPQSLALMLAASVQQWPHEHMVTNGEGKAAGPWLIERALRAVKDSGEIDLPDEFTFHDLRHYLASLLIASGADIKTVQARLRHASAKTTLDTYGHLWPDADESTRLAIDAVIAKRMDSAESSAY